MKTTLQILTEARSIINKGFYQRGYYDGGHCYCAVGAINMAAEGEACASGSDDPLRNGPTRNRSIFFLANAIFGGEKSNLDEVFHFNDKNKKEVVLAAFDRAISNARRRHISKTPLKVSA